jgi:hypothetical protein
MFVLLYSKMLILVLGPTQPVIYISLVVKWLKHEVIYSPVYRVVPRLRMRGAILLPSVCLDSVVIW